MISDKFFVLRNRRQFCKSF